MTKLSNFGQKLIVWLTAYVNVIAFVLGGGYIFLKSDDEDARGSAKLALFTYAGFAALDLTRALIYNILSLCGAGYDTLAAMSDVSLVIAILRTVSFVTLFILDLCGILGAIKGKISALGTKAVSAVADDDDADDKDDDN